MTRPGAPRDPEELRDTEDLRGVFREHEGPTVDVAGLLTGVRERIARRRYRRRTARILAAGVATALIAAIPIVVSSLPDEDPNTTAESGAANESSDPGGAEEPGVLSDPGAGSEGFDPAATFTVEALPPGYNYDSASSEFGIQARYYASLGKDPQSQLMIRYFEPALSGLSVPVVAPDGVFVGDLEVFPMALDPGGMERYGVAWQPEPGRWVTVISTASDDLARQEVMETVPAIDLGSQQRLTFPIQVTDVPEGFALRASRRNIQADPGRGQLTAGLSLDDRPGISRADAALSIYAEDNPQQATTGPQRPEHHHVRLPRALLRRRQRNRVLHRLSGGRDELQHQRLARVRRPVHRGRPAPNCYRHRRGPRCS